MPNDARFGLFDVLRLMACHPSVAPMASDERRTDRESQPADDKRRRWCKLLRATSAHEIAASLSRPSARKR